MLRALPEERCEIALARLVHHGRQHGRHGRKKAELADLALDARHFGQAEGVDLLGRLRERGLAQDAQAVVGRAALDEAHARVPVVARARPDLGLDAVAVAREGRVDLAPDQLLELRAECSVVLGGGDQRTGGERCRQQLLQLRQRVRDRLRRRDAAARQAAAQVGRALVDVLRHRAPARQGVALLGVRARGLVGPERQELVLRAAAPVEVPGGDVDVERLHVELRAPVLEQQAPRDAVGVREPGFGQRLRAREQRRAALCARLLARGRVVLQPRVAARIAELGGEARRELELRVPRVAANAGQPGIRDAGRAALLRARRALCGAAGGYAEREQGGGDQRALVHRRRRSSTWESAVRTRI